MRKHIAATVAASAAVLAIASPAMAQPGPPSSVFDPPSVGWASVRDLTSAQFGTAFDTWKAKGYLVTDLEVDVSGGDYRVGAVFQENIDHRAWKSLRDLTAAQYASEQASAAGAGLRQIDFETYELGGARRFAAVWIQNKEHLASSARHDLSGAQFASYRAEQAQAGRMPVDVEQYVTDGAVRFAAVWVANPEHLSWTLETDLTGAQYSTAFAAHQGTQRSLVVDSASTPAGQRYSMVMVGNPGGRAWRERRDLTATDFANWWHRYSDEGYRLVSYDRYATAGGTRYAGIWRQNSDRPAWSKRSTVDARVQSELDTHNVPGISAAIIQNGQLRYLRGFGSADLAANEWLDSGHVLGLASVSKAVSGTMAVRLAEQNKISVNKKVSTYLPGLPAQHTYTVEQVASNRGCVQHYNEGSGFGNATPYTTALSSAQAFWNDPLVCTVGTEHYSTHGYTIMCAALEAATGKNHRDLIEAELTNPLQLGTLRPQRLEDSGVRRARRYSDSNAPIATPDETAKICGGGMESSVHDLAEFGRKVLAGQVVNPADRDAMWHPANGWDYAYGWNNDVVDGHRIVAKNGANAGAQAYLRIYPNDGVVVALLSNRKSGGHDLAKLGRDLGELVIA